MRTHANPSDYLSAAIEGFPTFMMTVPASPRRFSVDVLMGIFIGLAFTIFFSLACRKYGYFNGETNDLTVYSHAMARTGHGRFMPIYFTNQSFLEIRIDLIMLMWLPIYKLWPSFYSLLFYQSLMLTIAAWPFFLLAKHVLKNERAALALGVAFLLFPTIASQHVNQFHDDQMALPFMMFAFYFFVKEDFRKFMCMMVLACLAKESVTITTAAFGVYALFLRRSWKWVVTPIAFSVAYLIIAVKIMSAGVSGIGAGLYTGTTYLEAYGKTPAEVLKTFVTRPGFVLETVFSGPKIDFLWKLFLPVLFVLPILTFAIVVTLPNLLLNLVASNSAMIVIPWHYNILVGGTLLAASVMGIKRLTDWFPRYAHKLLLGLPAAMVGLSLVGAQFWYRAEEYQAKPYQATLERVVEAIPANAAVLCPTPMLAEFSNRPKVLSAYSLLVMDKKPERLTDYDFIILDGNWRAYEAIGQMQLVKLFNENPALQQRFRTVLHEDNVFVLQQVR
jgi:uncharacterized membrane protein